MGKGPNFVPETSLDRWDIVRISMTIKWPGDTAHAKNPENFGHPTNRLPAGQ
jgi:hypothetical protein